MNHNPLVRLRMLTLITALVVSGAGCSGVRSESEGKGLKRFEFSRQTLGQPLRLVMYVADKQAANKAKDAVFAKLTEVEARLDSRNPASEVAKLSEAAGGPWMPVSQELFTVLQRAIQFSDETGGEYDITAGAAVALWDDAATSKKAPTEDEIRTTKALIGSRMLQINSIDRTARLLLPGMVIDLEPLDSGYAVDMALWTLRRSGVRRAMAEIRSAGVAAAIGTPPGEVGWKMTIPVPDGKGKPTVLMLANDGASWTPEVRKPVAIGSFRYVGLINAQSATPKPMVSRVTVLAPGAFLASGIRQGVTLLGSPTAAGPFIRLNGRARVSFARTDALR